MLNVNIKNVLGDFELDAQFEAPITGVTALFGKSGSGKSSIINAIAGLIRPRAGKISFGSQTFFDHETSIHLAPEKRRIGYVFQDSKLFPHMSVEKNLRYGMQRSAVPADEALLNLTVETLDLRHLMSRRPQFLSGGEKQRVALGRAFLMRPQLLLLDEPLASLDSDRKNEILGYIERITRLDEIPALYVSHAIEEIVRLADHLIIVSEGKVAGHGPAVEILNRQDLVGQSGEWDLSVVLDAKITGQDVSRNLSMLRLDGDFLRVPLIQGQLGKTVRVRIRAREVMLATDKPVNISAQNILRGKISKIASSASGVCDVSVAVGKSILVARVTTESTSRLQLTEGKEVYAVIKSVSVDRYSDRDGVSGKSEKMTAAPSSDGGLTSKP